jgi:hypothetical protein
MEYYIKCFATQLKGETNEIWDEYKVMISALDMCTDVLIFKFKCIRV